MDPRTTRVYAAPSVTPLAQSEFDGVAVFAATMVKDRELVGERVTAWLDQHPDRLVVDAVVTQSSDAAFHCITITLFWSEQGH